MYYDIYSRSQNGDLHLVGNLRGESAKAVLEDFLTNHYHPEYGRLVVLEVNDQYRKHERYALVEELN